MKYIIDIPNEMVIKSPLKGMNISIVLAMANVETLEGLTAEGYNRIVKVLREM